MLVSSTGWTSIGSYSRPRLGPLLIQIPRSFRNSELLGVFIHFCINTLMFIDRMHTSSVLNSPSVIIINSIKYRFHLHRVVNIEHTLCLGVFLNRNQEGGRNSPSDMVQDSYGVLSHLVGQGVVCALGKGA